MVYKFACCSDTHAGPLPKIETDGLTAWLHAGDLYNLGDLHNDMLRNTPLPTMEEMREQIKAKNLPFYVVRGNHDCSDISFLFRQNNEVTGRCVRIADDLLLVGLGWTGWKYYDLPRNMDMESVCHKAQLEFESIKKDGDKVIMLTHYVPWFNGQIFQCDGEVAGWAYECIAQLMEIVRPMAVIMGHVHQLFGQQVTYNGTNTVSLVVSAGPKGGILTIDTTASSVVYEPCLSKKARKRRGKKAT